MTTYGSSTEQTTETGTTEQTTEMSSTSFTTREMTTESTVSTTMEMTTFGSSTEQSTEAATTESLLFATTEETLPMVDVTSLVLSIELGYHFREWTNNVVLPFDVVVSTNSNSSSIAGTGLWKLLMTIPNSDNLESNDTVIAQISHEEENQAVLPGGNLYFNNSFVTLNLSGILCPELQSICVSLVKGDEPSVDFILQGSLATCMPVDCRGVEITTTVDVGNEVVLQEREGDQSFNFTLTLDPDPNAGSIEGDDLWHVTTFFSQSDDALGTAIGEVTHSLRSDQSGLSLYSGIQDTMVLGREVNLTGLACDEVAYFCVVIEKDQMASPNFTFVNPATDCTPVACQGLVISSTVLILSSGDVVNEHSSAHTFSFDVTLNSNAESGSIQGTDLWEINILLSADINATERYAETSVALSQGQRDQGLFGGSNAIISGVAATVDLSSLDCRQLNYVCVEVSRDNTSSPAFTISGDLQACSEITCQGVQITDSDLTITSGDSIIERSGIHSVRFDIILTSDATAASISGENLWELEVFLTPIQYDYDSSEVRTTPGLIDSVSDADLTAGTDLPLAAVEASFDLGLVTCDKMVYMCVSVSRNTTSDPYFTLEGIPDENILTACHLITCTGVIVTSTELSLEAGFYFLEHTSNQSLTFDVDLAASAAGASISGSNLWSVDVEMSGGDGTLLDTDVILIPGGQNDTLLSAGGNLTLVNLETVLSVDDVCQSIYNICVTVSKNLASDPDFTIEPESQLTSCAELSCTGVIITDVIPELTYGDIVAKGDDAHSVTFNVAVTSSSLGSDRVGDGSWQLAAFLSDSANGTTDVLSVSPTLTTAQTNADLVAGGTVNFSGVEIELDTSSLQCADFSYLCITLSKGASPVPDFTLEVSPDEGALTGCVAITCEEVIIGLNATDVDETSIVLSWNEPNGDYNGYDITISPLETGLMSPVSLTRNVTTLSIGGLIPARLYTFDIGLSEDGTRKNTATETITVRTYPNAVEMLNVSSITEQQFLVQWVRPEGDFDQYEVTLVPGDGDTDAVSTLANTEDSLFYNGLVPMTKYTVTIVTLAGSRRSEETSVQAITESIEPFLQVNSYTTTNITLTIAVNSLIVHGDLELSYFPPGNVSMPIVLSINTTEYTLTDLTAGRNYTIEALVYADVDGQRISSTTATVTQRTDPNPPGEISLLAATETSLQIEWVPTDGDYDNYQLTFSPNPQSESMPIVIPNGSPIIQVHEYIAVGLDPATDYTFTVTTESADGTLSDSVTATFNTLPVRPGNVTVDGVERTSVAISWEPADAGRFISYKVTYSPTTSGAAPSSPFITNDTSANITNLIPDTTYTFSVQTKLDDMYSAAVQAEATTLTDLPSAVSYVTVTVGSDSARDANVSIGAPDEPNGVITFYRIVIVGTKSGEPTIQLVLNLTPSPDANVTDLELRNLLAGYTYVFTVRARNSQGFGEALSSEPVTMPILPIPDPDDNVLATETSRLKTTSSSIAIRISNNIFDESNGKIVSYAIIVVQDGAENIPISVPPLSYNDVKDKDPWPPYQTSNPFNLFDAGNGGRKKRDATAYANYAIGSETCQEGVKYCNGPLKPGVKYRYKIRGVNELGNYTDTPYSEPLQTRMDSFWLVYAIIGALILLGITLSIWLAYYLWYKGRGKEREMEIKERRLEKMRHTYINRSYVANKREKVEMNGHAGNTSMKVNQIDLDTSLFYVKKSNTSRSIPVMVFREYVDKLSEDDNQGFEDEYNELCRVVFRKSTQIGQRVSNRMKNRFFTIIPYDDDRVTLRGSGTEDYINASYISGPVGPRSYIATQGPLRDTTVDFWRMVWQHKVSTVVMITLCIEEGKDKCYKYWPEYGQPERHGSVEVTMSSETELPDWTIRDFSIERGGHIRPLRQFQFTTWPTQGVPHDADPLLRFVRTVRDQIKPSEGPIIVHCSAGVGRTAVYIALDDILAKLSKRVDIFRTVLSMRKQRPYMIQTQSQYEFIYFAMYQHLKYQTMEPNWSYGAPVDRNWSMANGNGTGSWRNGRRRGPHDYLSSFDMVDV